jgi:hypothetical protein
MSRLCSSNGYALLAALVITCLAGVFSATCVAAVGARFDIAAADSGGVRAQAALSRGLDDVCSRLRRSPSATEGSYRGALANPDGDAWVAAWTGLTRTSTEGFPQVGVELQASAGSARARLSAVIELRAQACAQGVVVAEDAELRAPVQVAGSGFYCGGSVRGREWLRFGDGTEPAAGATPAADGVHGDLWPVAAVHAAGGIWATGVEIHEDPSAEPWAADTDTHTGETGVSAMTRPPAADIMCFLGEQAVAPGEALSDGVLDLEKLPDHASGAAASETDGGGYAVLVRPLEAAALRIIGERAAGSCPLTLVVDGDAQVGCPGRETRVEGTLIVLGALDIAGSLRLEGHLSARSLCVHAPADLVVPTDWRRHPHSGLAVPTIVALAGP